MSIPVAAPASPVHPLDHYHEDRALRPPSSTNGPSIRQRGRNRRPRTMNAALRQPNLSGSHSWGTLAYLAVLTLAPTRALRILG
jgi:hypothetical protein